MEIFNKLDEGSCCSSIPLSMDRGPSAYIEYKTLVSSITSELKFNPIEFEIKPVQLVYLNPILKYINSSLVTCESDDVYEKIYAMVDSMNDMDNLILEGDINQICFLLSYQNKCNFEIIPYTMLWINISTNIKLKLDYNYGWRTKTRSKLKTCPCDSCQCVGCIKGCCWCCGNNSYNLENMYSGRPIQDCYYSSSEGYKERW